MDETTELRLLSAHNEAGNVRTFVFETGGIQWVAGQSQGYRLPQAGDAEAENERWFTIASAPSEDEIHISTRVTQSKFKQTLNALQPGATIHAYGLEGDFTWESEEPTVLVAGGIGITPFRSILVNRDAVGKPLNAKLLYFNRIDEIPFLEEFQALAKHHPELTLLPIVGRDITADTILELAPEAGDRIVYLSGPEPMVEAVGNDLRQKGIDPKQDWFPGYDAKNF